MRLTSESRRGVLPLGDVELQYVDFGGAGETALLLHGLCGTADEWADTALWLSETHRVIAIDQRGHGRSTRRPISVRPQSFVDDAVHVFNHLGLRPGLVVGQSMGARIAFSLAAQHPNLVARLIVVEATPTVAPDDKGYENIKALLQAWPVPFGSLEAAKEFFGGTSLAARVWAESLEERNDGLWPRFDIDIMLRTIREFHQIDWWPIWRQVKQPTLIIGGEKSTSVNKADFVKMIEAVPQSTYVDVQGAGHDVHLERPEAWRRLVSNFSRKHPHQRDKT